MEENNRSVGPSMSEVKEAEEQSKQKVVEQPRQPGEAPKPTEYQKRLIAQWHETGHSGPAPFASDGKELFWLNRQQRRARAAIARKRK
jgi:hypothetical protein